MVASLFSNQHVQLPLIFTPTVVYTIFLSSILKSNQSSSKPSNKKMASLSMTATSLAGFAAAGISGSPRRSLIVAKAASPVAAAEPEKVSSVSVSMKEERFNGRRDLVFAAAAAAAATFAGVAMADEEEEEPKKGTAAAKKKYAPICVSMPTARICHNIK